jgi:sec-independent protein translocase protein TatB
MFGISFSEIILILIIALLVLGPKQLPDIVIKIRKFIIAFRHFASNLKQEVYQQSGFNELNNTKNLLIDGYQQIKNNILTNELIDIPNTGYINEPIQPELEFDKDPELF